MFLRFCLVGTLGFLVDSGLLLLLTQTGIAGAMTGRLMSFGVAVLVTWSLNRRYTFRSRATTSSLVPYIALTGIGALINIGVYRLWLAAFGEGPVMFVLGVAAGSITALAFNFLVSKRIIFQPGQPRPSDVSKPPSHHM